MLGHLSPGAASPELYVPTLRRNVERHQRRMGPHDHVVKREGAVRHNQQAIEGKRHTGKGDRRTLSKSRWAQSAYANGQHDGWDIHSRNDQQHATDEHSRHTEGERVLRGAQLQSTKSGEHPDMLWSMRWRAGQPAHQILQRSLESEGRVRGANRNAHQSA